MVFSETSTIQKDVIARLVAAGWTHIPGSKLNRSNEAVLIESDLAEAIRRLNPQWAGDDTRVDQVITMLRLLMVNSSDDGLLVANEKFTTWLRGRGTVSVEDSGLDENVRLIDFDHPENNILIVSDEVTYGTPGNAARFDVVVWVNGIPLVVGETKTPVDHKISWMHGAKDVYGTYEVERPHFFVPNLLSFATEGREFRYAAIRTQIDRWEQWGSTQVDANMSGWPRVRLAVDELLNPAVLLSVLEDYALFERGQRNGVPSMTKIVPRYFQHETVEAIVSRVVAGAPRRGLIYHTQGSGKTLAMSWAATRLIHEPSLKNPTIVVIADRSQLVRQTFAQFDAAGSVGRLQEASSSRELHQLLRANQRGVVVTTIHKFKDAGLLSERENIIVLVDEAHRTQEGSLGQQMRASLPNAFLFGFTGTPIADLERNTFKLFGDESDPDFALNTYNSDRSIADGTTVPMRVSSRMVEFQIDKDNLDEEFDALAKAEGLTDAEQAKVAANLSTVATLLANPQRIEAVCRDILEHFYSTIDPLGMKAQIVLYNRALCVAYYETLSRLLTERGDDEAAVVMSLAGKDDPTEWETYRLSESEEEQILDRFRSPTDKLKFVLVTAKLGTGFNAPIEGVLYLDKPMKLHTLFQTITRTNRPWTNSETGQKKKFGLIVDYIGLGDGFARAMTPNNPEAKQRELDVESLIDAFSGELDSMLDRFVGIDRTDSSADTLMSAIDRVPPGDSRARFGQQFMMAQSLWETVAPHPELEARRSDYRWVAKIYEAVTPTDLSSLLWERFGAKTRELVFANISEIRVRNPQLTVQIADSTTVQKLIDEGLLDDDDTESKQKTADEIIDSIAGRLKRRLAGPNQNHAIYQSLADRLDRLRESELSRAKVSVEFLRELFTLAKDVKSAEHAEDQSGAAGLDLLPDPKVGALTQIFEEFAPEGTPVMIADIVTEIDRIARTVSYTGWNTKDDGRKLVRRSLLKAFKGFGLPLTGEPFESAYQYIETHY
ncbi:restriction enzyme type I helicase subunits and related helicase [marine actinobacterium PHSC20C1]|nr:restriction enzyme type I helicase subunits and related helicase [marine actinobacterium PHSC20C1]